MGPRRRSSTTGQGAFWARCRVLDTCSIEPPQRARPAALLAFHAGGEWGDLNDQDKQANELAVKTGARIFSRFVVEGKAIYVITDTASEDGIRSTTAILLEGEY